MFILFYFIKNFFLIVVIVSCCTHTHTQMSSSRRRKQARKNDEGGGLADQLLRAFASGTATIRSRVRFHHLTELRIRSSVYERTDSDLLDCVKHHQERYERAQEECGSTLFEVMKNETQEGMGAMQMIILFFLSLCRFFVGEVPQTLLDRISKVTVQHYLVDDRNEKLRATWNEKLAAYARLNFFYSCTPLLPEMSRVFLTTFESLITRMEQAAENSTIYETFENSDIVNYFSNLQKDPEYTIEHTRDFLSEVKMNNILFCGLTPEEWLEDDSNSHVLNCAAVLRNFTASAHTEDLMCWLLSVQLTMRSVSMLRQKDSTSLTKHERNTLFGGVQLLEIEQAVYGHNHIQSIFRFPESFAARPLEQSGDGEKKTNNKFGGECEDSRQLYLTCRVSLNRTTTTALLEDEDEDKWVVLELGIVAYLFGTTHKKEIETAILNFSN